ncbi:MAG TPA: ion transporter [Xanthomonadales bacterium]|nr:ion transporter [Xanthomonadales bacterium]
MTKGAAQKPRLTEHPNEGSTTPLASLVESRAFNLSITILIAVNAVTLGLETWPVAMQAAGPFLIALDHAILLVFTAELLLKLWVYRGVFFREPWNVFDLIVVTIGWAPSAGPFAVLRALRVLRVLRLISFIPQMRAVVAALLQSLPGMGAIISVLLLIYYVAAVMATNLFGLVFPEWFGSIGESMYSLFQIMTLESWSMGIVRPVMVEFPYAWTFFVPFIVVTSFAVLNLFIALIVNSMQNVHAQSRKAAEDEAKQAHDERETLSEQLKSLTEEVRQLRNVIKPDH